MLMEIVEKIGQLYKSNKCDLNDAQQKIVRLDG